MIGSGLYSIFPLLIYILLLPPTMAAVLPLQMSPRRFVFIILAFVVSRSLHCRLNRDTNMEHVLAESALSLDNRF